MPVFLTFSGGFKERVSAPQGGLVTNVNPPSSSRDLGFTAEGSK